MVKLIQPFHTIMKMLKILLTSGREIIKNLSIDEHINKSITILIYVIIIVLSVKKWEQAWPNKPIKFNLNLSYLSIFRDKFRWMISLLLRPHSLRRKLLTTLWIGSRKIKKREKMERSTKNMTLNWRKPRRPLNLIKKMNMNLKTLNPSPWKWRRTKEAAKRKNQKKWIKMWRQGQSPWCPWKTTAKIEEKNTEWARCYELW